MYLIYFFTVFAILPRPTLADGPTVTVENGTYIGNFVPEWQQDHFLGIPYAAPPIGALRFARPQCLNSSFSETRTATNYGFSCYQYGTNFSLSEDCLNLNVIRPAGINRSARLPVLVWVFGGGLYTGSTADPQYNLSGITHLGQVIGKPVIAVSINYRLGVWGFLQTPVLLAEGNSNAGLLDQRMAFRWIKENIEAFGGDPNRITLWGESAGAQSIGYHLHSYDGRNDGLFHQAIMESGSTVGTSVQDLAYYTSPVENLTRTTNCYTSPNQLACLRNLTSKQLYQARISQVWNPLIDGDFLTAYPSTLMAQGKFIHIPLLIGANSDEGCSFGSTGLNTETDIFNNLLSYRSYAISPPTARKLLALYPNEPAHEPPYYITNATIFPSKGRQWRRECAIAGDLVMISGRRKTCQAYASAKLPVFSYRFDTPLWNAAVTDGAKHFVNVVFSFQNISGALGPLPEYASYKILSNSIGTAYISFAESGDPNRGGNNGLPYWPPYQTAKPQNMVLNSNKTYVEADTFRKEAIDYINTIDRELLA